MALYNTAFGLIVAIPSLIFWRYFRGRVDEYLLTLELSAERFARHLNSLRVKRDERRRMNFRPRQKEEPEINLIPFIDVLLVILIFLMLTTTYSKFTELQLKLPVADADAQRDYPKEVIVAVSSDGRYSVKGTPVTGRSVEAVAQALTEAAKAGKDSVVIITRRRHRPAPVRHYRDGGGAPLGPERRSLSRPSPRRRPGIADHGRRAAARMAAARRRLPACCGRFRWCSAPWRRCAAAPIGPACSRRHRMPVPGDRRRQRRRRRRPARRRW